MKKIITIIALIIVLVIDLSGIETPCNSITVDTNAPRTHDIIEKKQISTINPLLGGDSLIWNISGYKLGNERTVQYVEYIDGLIIENENKANRFYLLNNDTLFLKQHGQAGMMVNYYLPEAVMKYPLEYGNSFSGYFYGEGNIGNVTYIRNAGHSSTSVDARGVFITPEGDTLNNVIRTHYHRIGTTHINDNFRQSFNVTRDSTKLCGDSISYWLRNDSVLHSIDKWSWYARGYRYPIAETVKNKVYYYDTPVDSVSTSYYYRVIDQECNITDDNVNEIIRNNWDQTSNNNPSFTLTSKGRNNKHDGGNTRNKGNRNNDNIYNGNSGGNNIYSNEATSFPSCVLSPIIVKNETIATIVIETPSEVVITLHSASGAIMWRNEKHRDAGTHQIRCPMQNLPAGNYVVITKINAELFAEKIIKIN